MPPPKKPDLCKGQVVAFDYHEGLKMTDEMMQVYDWDGAFLVKGMFNSEEVKAMEKGLTTSPEFLKHAFDVADGTGRASRLVLWSHPGEDVTGMVGRCEKVVNICEEILGGEVYHYHTKVLMKEPRTGGQHLWHQDYGYWYKNGMLTPDCVTAYIAVDHCVPENGCLQVVLGTHRCGRIEHDLLHGQTVANQERVDQLCKHFPKVHAVMEPGDCMFFHSNLLHTSAANDSDMRRWAFLSSYNLKANNPVYVHHHPQYTPLTKVPNSAILECTNYTDLNGKDFMDPQSDKTVRGKLAETGFH